MFFSHTRIQHIATASTTHAMEAAHSRLRAAMALVQQEEVKLQREEQRQLSIADKESAILRTVENCDEDLALASELIKVRREQLVQAMVEKSTLLDLKKEALLELARVRAGLDDEEKEKKSAAKRVKREPRRLE